MVHRFFIDIDRSSKKIIIIYLAVFGSIITLLIIYFITKSNRLIKEQLLSIERHTKVIELFNNKKEHNFPYVRYSDGKQKILEYPYEIGESVSKNKGDSIENIFRKDSIIKNNLFEMYR